VVDACATPAELFLRDTKAYRFSHDYLLKHKATYQHELNENMSMIQKVWKLMKVRSLEARQRNDLIRAKPDSERTAEERSIIAYRDMANAAAAIYRSVTMTLVVRAAGGIAESSLD